MNTFGNIYRLTSFGESHGRAIGGVIDGIPAGTVLSLKALQEALDRRRPGASAQVTQRREPDHVEILSGLMALCEGELAGLSDDTDTVVALGTPIGFMVRNTDQHSQAYDNIRELYRPNHADFTYDRKYGLRDWRGGGRSSGRETISRVVAGSFAEQALRPLGISFTAKVTEIGGSADPSQFAAIIDECRAKGDSVGGVVTATVTGLPAGLGEPTFAKLQQMLASAMFSIGGVHGFEYGDGFALAGMHGTAAADLMDAGGWRSNHCGGILGGISNGQPVTLRVAFKPTPSVSVELPTLDTCGRETTLCTKGRHDPCIAIRGCEVVRAMAAMIIYDAWLMNLSAKSTIPGAYSRDRFNPQCPCE